MVTPFRGFARSVRRLTDKHYSTAGFRRDGNKIAGQHVLPAIAEISRHCPPDMFFHRDLRRRIEAARPRLFRLACSWTHNTAQADDLTQEALLRAMERLNQLRDHARLEAWLAQILLNCWHDQLRAARPMTDIDAIADFVAAPSIPLEDSVTAAQEARAVRAAVAQLPIAQREVLTLIDLGECRYAEVAAMLNVPIGTVMSRLARARAALAAALIGVSGAQSHRAPLRRVK
jgi:RNA polymerase sigma-70 factor (ECF subfamily)